jgi:PAS domain S-box-containing protein
MRPQDLGIGTLFESVRDAVVVAEANTGRIVLWNPAATEIFEYSPSEALELRIEALAEAPLDDEQPVEGGEAGIVGMFTHKCGPV